jgi:hypothetical protein
MNILFNILVVYMNLQEMSLADFLRSNLPSTDPDPADQEDPGIVSCPIVWNTPGVTIPEDEHTIFTAVRYNDCHRIDQLLRQSIDVNISHTCEQVSFNLVLGKLGKKFNHSVAVNWVRSPMAR